MKKNWKEKKLGDIGMIGAGNSAPQDKALFDKGKYPFFRTADVGNIHIGKISTSQDYLNERGIIGLKKFQKGTILFPKSGASTFLNHRVIMETDGFVVSHLATIKADNKIILDQYLLYYLLTIDSKKLVQEHSYPSINLPLISSIVIKFPSDIKEQKQIVEKLDKAFADIDKLTEIAKQNLENSKELFNSYLNKLFTENKDWEETTLNDICKKIFAGGDKPVNFSKIENKKYSIPVVANGIENDGLLGFTDVATVMDKAITISARGTIGFVCKRNKPFCPIVRLIVVIPKTDKVTIDFLYYLLQTLIPKSNGSSIPQLTIPNFKYSKIKLPPLQQQKEIVKILDNLQEKTKKIEEIYNKKVELAKELKQSILHKELSNN